MQVLLDTQVIYIAAIDGLEALPKKVQTLLSDGETERILSAASIMEVALKGGKNKPGMGIGEPELRQAIRDLQLTIIPFTPQHAYRIFSLPLHHRDPFDRMIIATALTENIPLIGADREFKKYKGLHVIW